MQVYIRKILGDDVKVTDEEVAKFIEDNKDLLPEDEDPATTKENAKIQLEQQKLTQKYQEWMTKLRAQANIMSFVDYGTGNQ